MIRTLRLSVPALAACFFALSLVQGAAAQSDEPRSVAAQATATHSVAVQTAPGQPMPGEAVTMTLDEAIQIALVQAYGVRNARLDLEEGKALVGEGWGQVYPQIALNSQYTRNFRSANPFAGSQAGDLFSGFGFIDWLAFNEGARTDADPGTDPITLEDFFARQQAGIDATGFQQSTSDNPFAVENQVFNTVSIEQKVFDIRTFWGISGAQKYLSAARQAGLERQEQLIVDEVRRTFYGALLADENALVLAQSLDRVGRTAQEAAVRVAQGTAPKYERLSAEVRQANVETELISARNAAADAIDGLKMRLGVPVDRQLVLRGSLEDMQDTRLVTVSVEGAAEAAVLRRPDLEQARLNVRLQQVQKKVAKADYYPSLNAFVNLGYTGGIPDGRTFLLSDPTDPFLFSTRSNGFFSDSYWDFTVSGGFRLSWTLFDGMQTRRRIQQRQIAVERAEIAAEQLEQGVRLEVQSALRSLRAAELRIASQRRNLDRADLNYTYAGARLREGVGSHLEEREASDLLDQSRIGYLSAVYDYLIAQSALEAAMGDDPKASTHLNLTNAVPRP